MLAVRHAARVLGGLFVHAVRTRRPGRLVLVVIGGTVVLLAIVAQAIGPVAIYPFL